jgi:hypothetical protein
MPDWLDSEAAVTDGTCIVRIKQNNPSVVWEIQQVTVVVGPTSTSGNVGIFKNGNMVTPTSALTPIITSVGAKAIGQTAAGLPYVYIRATDELQVIASSINHLDNVTVRAQYREYRVDDPISGSA